MTERPRNGGFFSWLWQAKWALGGAVIFSLLLFWMYSRRVEDSQISVVYGERNTRSGQRSINGDAVLAGMFKNAGFQVSSWRKLSPKLNRAKVIVWTPDDYAPPTQEQREWLEEWLSGTAGRRLIYIGRDYDAEIDYWKRTKQTASPRQQIEIERKIALRKVRDDLRGKETEEQDVEWFRVEKGVRRQVKHLIGPWSRGIDDSKTEVYVDTRLRAPESEPLDSRPDLNSYGYYDTDFSVYADVLLSTENDEELVTRLTRGDWPDGELIVVTNGSFLLNLPLVNHEHRKLADKLIDECGKPGRVVFLESGPGGPPIRETDGAGGQTGLEMLMVAPLNIILLHFVALGVVLLISSFPIFGRPRELKSEAVSDFSKHVEAIAEQLEKIGDVGYSIQKLAYYNEHVRQEAAPATPAAQRVVKKRNLRIRISTPIAPGERDRRAIEAFEQQAHDRGIGQVLTSHIDTNGMEIVVTTPDTPEALVQLRALLTELGLDQHSVITEIVHHSSGSTA